MNRRKFLSWLGMGTAVVAVAPSALLSGSPACVAVAPAARYATYIMGTNAMIGEYANYANFSDFAISAAIDDVVSNTAAELSHRAGYSIRELVKTSQVSFS